MLRAACGKLVRQGKQALRPAFQRGFADAAPSTAVAPQLDWDALQEFVTTAEGKTELAQLRRTIADYTREPQPVAPLDLFEEFGDQVDEDILEQYQEAVEEIEESIPAVSTDKIAESLKADYEPLIKAAEDLKAQAQKDIDQVHKDLEALDRYEAKMEKMTGDEALAENPEIAEEIDREISEDNYLPH